MNQDSHLAREELDAFLTARLSGKNVPAPTGLPAVEAALTDELVALAEAIQPDPTFVADVETQLVRVGKSNRRPASMSLWQNLVGSLATRRFLWTCQGGDDDARVVDRVARRKARPE